MAQPELTGLKSCGVECGRYLGLIVTVGEYGRLEMISTVKKVPYQYITIAADCLHYMAGEAYAWGNKETGGPLYGLLTHAGRIVLMLAGPGGPNAKRDAAHFAMDTDYVTALNRYIQEKFGAQYIGTWHSHHSLGLDHPSSGDVEQNNRLADRCNIGSMVQLVLTRQDAATPGRQTTMLNEVKERLLNNAKSAVSEIDAEKQKGRGNCPVIRVNAFIYEDAAGSPYARCPIKILSGTSLIRKALANTGILEMPGKPVFEYVPIEKITYDEVRTLPGTSTEQYIPYILAKQFNELSDEVAGRTEICTYGEGRIALSLPLPNGLRLCVTYTAKVSPPRLNSVSVLYPDARIVIDLTNDVHVSGDYAALRTICRNVEDMLRGKNIERLNPSIWRNRYFVSKLNKGKGVV